MKSSGNFLHDKNMAHRKEAGMNKMHDKYGQNIIEYVKRFNTTSTFKSRKAPLHKQTPCSSSTHIYIEVMANTQPRRNSGWYLRKRLSLYLTLVVHLRARWFFPPPPPHTHTHARVCARELTPRMVWLSEWAQIETAHPGWRGKCSARSCHRPPGSEEPFVPTKRKKEKANRVFQLPKTIG